jgi:hypothetical protein
MTLKSVLGKAGLALIELDHSITANRPISRFQRYLKRELLELKKVEYILEIQLMQNFRLRGAVS